LQTILIPHPPTNPERNLRYSADLRRFQRRAGPQGARTLAVRNPGLIGEGVTLLLHSLRKIAWHIGSA
jgi:hypothetical protein